MYTILKKFNEQLEAVNCSIILFMDNADRHLVGKYSNIKIAFLPANTTAVFQPLDLGIIKTLKVIIISFCYVMYFHKLRSVPQLMMLYNQKTILSPSGGLLANGVIRYCKENASAKQTF